MRVKTQNDALTENPRLGLRKVNLLPFRVLPIFGRKSALKQSEVSEVHHARRCLYLKCLSGRYSSTQTTLTRTSRIKGPEPLGDPEQKKIYFLQGEGATSTPGPSPHLSRATRIGLMWRGRNRSRGAGAHSSSQFFLSVSCYVCPEAINRRSKPAAFGVSLFLFKERKTKHHPIFGFAVRISLNFELKLGKENVPESRMRNTYT